jgi:multiple sugar transport system permease protein
VLADLAALLVLAAFLLPLAWLILLSFKSRLDIFAWPPAFWGFTPTLENYTAVLGGARSFLPALRNSLLVAFSATALSLLAGVSAGFALAKARVRGAAPIGLALLFFRMVPPAALLLPYYLMFRAAGMLGTLTAVAVTHAVFAVSIVLWMLRDAFAELPDEIEEAAMMDGASTWQSFRRISLPLVRPAITAAAIFAFMTSWNEFVFAASLSDGNTRTVPVAVSGYVGDAYVSWGELAAASTLGMLPALALAFFGQRYLIRGLTAGAFK